MDTQPTKPVPVYDVVTVDVDHDGDAMLLRALRQQKVEWREGDHQLMIVDLSRYSLCAATSRHVDVVASWIAEQVHKCPAATLEVAIVVPAELLQTAWTLVETAECPGASMTVFSDVSRAYQWATQKLEGPLTGE